MNLKQLITSFVIGFSLPYFGFNPFVNTGAWLLAAIPCSLFSVWLFPDKK